MSGSEVRVLRREAGPDNPGPGARMPAWKREILERRKAKSGGAGAAEPSPGSVRTNGELPAGGGKDSDGKDSASSAGRNFSVTTASQHFGTRRSGGSPDLSPVKTNKELSLHAPAATDTCGTAVGQESLVLKDSLGPLDENPFIKLEKERRRRQDKDSATRPVQHILELYGNVPGIKTIRADNIIIIESDPDYFQEPGGGKAAAGPRLQQNGTVSSYSSLSDLLDRRGSNVTEIRAREVVIYDSALSRSEENLSTLGRTGQEEEGWETGRVSRMLQKFDRNYGKLQPKSRSTENLLLEVEPSPVQPRTPPPDPVPKTPTSPPPLSPEWPSPAAPVLPPSPQSSIETPPDQDRGTSSSVSSYRRRFEDGVRIGPHRDRDYGGEKWLPNGVGAQRERLPWEKEEGIAMDMPAAATVPTAPEPVESVQAESPPQRSASRVPAPPRSASMPPPQGAHSPSFQILPSPLPDLSALPPGDIQARALANLRLQSRHSFTVIPRRPSPATVPTPPATPPSPQQQEREPAVRPAPAEPPLQPEPEAPPTPPPEPRHPRSPPTPPAQQLPPPTPVQFTGPEEEEEAEAEKNVGDGGKLHELDKLPVTNIDDIVTLEEPTTAALPGPVLQRRSGNTFTVVPKRKTDPQPPPTSTQPPPAPYAELGSMLKKRYPAVQDIQVIGGYLSLGRSCLRSGSTHKKLKISFNESSLHSTFEYPSESSLWESGEGEEEDDEREGEEEGEDDREEGGGVSQRIFIPHPSYSSSPTHTPNSSTDLSSYTPKHSVDFSTWQEHKYEESAPPGDSSSQRTELSREEVMLTPADDSSLSDFSSEPALYF